MVKFIDGPAKGVTLQLRRAPMYLRVTRKHGTSEWDALDQLDDRPRDDEEIFVYVAQSTPTGCHVRASGGRGGYFMIADYRYRPVQPSDDLMRGNHLWAHWVEAQVVESGGTA